MKKLKIEPGVCGFTAVVEADFDEDEGAVRLKVASGCKSVQKMLEDLGDTFDSYELCLKKPGEGPLYDYARAHFPGHAACPVVAGILKCAEAESGLALPRDASFTFL